MYKSKQEVDAHVRSALSKLRSESERYIRGLTIAKLYYKINEYEAAEQHLLAYLTVKEDNEQAHKMLGQCYLRLKKRDKALQSFQRSLQLNAKQPAVLVEVCQMLLEDKNLNMSKAQYWADLAESEKVQDDAVFALRLRLLNKNNLHTNHVEELIQKEISARPHDVQLRVRLVRSYIEQKRVLDAFNYVYKLEMNHNNSMNDAFHGSGEWYNVMWLALSKYEQLPNIKMDWEFWLLIAICLERQVCISFTILPAADTMSGGVTDTANLLFQLDQYLFKISQLADKLSAPRELVELFLEHFHGQLLLHSAALIFKRELLQNKNRWRETVKTVLPLLLLAYHRETPDSRQPWMKHCDEQGDHLVQLWIREGAFRCGQVGRTLLSCIQEDTGDKTNGVQQLTHLMGGPATMWDSSDSLLAQIRQTCSDQQWRRNIFALLFCNSDQRMKEQTSLLIRSAKLTEPRFEMPTYADVERHEETAQYLRPQSLQHMVYLCLGNDNLAYVRAKYFSGLNFSTQNLAFCGAESLNQLDVETFLYAATMQAKRMLAVDRENFDSFNTGFSSASGKPRLMPFVNLHGQLCSEEQANWWTAAYQVYKNLGCDNMVELRSNLQFGIEAVRGINGPKVDMIIVFQLGQLFVARAQDIVKPVEKALLEARAESIYKYGLNMLKMHNKGVLEPFRKYFKYVRANTAAVERQVDAAAEDAASYLAARYFKKLEYEELIDELSGVQLPLATYLQAEAYRKLDEANKAPRKAKRMYLDRASECMNQTLKLLQSTNTDPNHPLNSVIHAELKRLQHTTTKFLNDSASSDFVSPCGGGGAHSNSSTYEDAEADEFYGVSPRLSSFGAAGRSRREAAALIAASPRNIEMESLVKQMASTLSFVKEELVDAIKPEVLSMRKEITTLREKIVQLEGAMKKTSARRSNPLSPDDEASNVFDDLYSMESKLQNQLYQQATSQTHLSAAAVTAAANSLYSSATAGCCPTVPYGAQPLQQQPAQQQPPQRIHTPNALQMQSNAAAVAAAAYNSPMFTHPNYPLNYYTPTPYMMATQGAAAAAASNMLAQRNQLPLPFMDAGAGLAFNMPPPNIAHMPVPQQQQQQQPDGRSNNLFNIMQQQELQYPVALPSLASNVASTSAAQQPLLAAAVITNNNNNINSAINAAAVGGATNAPPPFNKAINNQPVERGPPANVVITSSDPLPNPNSVSVQAQQPTLSVTIPSHHIKQSLVQTPEALQPPTVGTNAFGGGFGAAAPAFGAPANPATMFGAPANNATMFGATPSTATMFGGNKTNSAANAITATAAFSFKPQVMQALQGNNSNNSDSGTQSHSGVGGGGGGDNSDVHNRTNDSAASASDNIEAEYDPRPDFKPIIALPDEIVVTTGEEDEEVLFCNRAKLFRRVDDEWKERGIGDIKILKDKAGHSRVLMRRDQTHKVCANHKITQELKLTAPKDELKSFIWAANDYADESLKLEMFFVRFKLPEMAKQFQDVFKRAQQEGADNAVASNDVATTKAGGFGLAKSAVASFATSTPSAKVGDNTAGLATKSASGPQFALGSSGSNASATTTTTNSGSTAGGVSKTLFGGAVNLVTKPAADDAKANTVSPFANFTFGGSGASVFSTPTASSAASSGSAVTTTTTASAVGAPFASIFGSNAGGQSQQSPFASLKLSNAFASPTVAQPVTAAVADSSSNAAEDAEDEYVPTAQFNPVIPLPDLIEVNTGEENELVLFEHRAKLLRFDKVVGEWKERGLGNIKLLQQKDDVNKLRLLMRRELVHKLCCNQHLAKDTAFNYAKNSQTALTWAGQDYAEETLVTELLTVRFKEAAICRQFLDTVKAAQAQMDAAADTNGVAAAIKPPAPTNGPSQKPAADSQPPAAGFGDAFKPKAGSWTCDGCYVTNGGDKVYCSACDAPKDATVPPKEQPAVSLTTSTKFSFGFTPAAASTATTTTTTTGAPPAKSGFTFGMTAAPAAANTNKAGGNAATASTTTTTTAAAPGGGVGFGDAFKPKAGSWTCDGCYVTNGGDKLYCSACDAPKDATVPPKEPTNSALTLSNPAQKFSFGFAAAGGDEATKPTASGGGFAFGVSPSATKSEPIAATATPFSSLAGATSSNSDAAKSFSFATPAAVPAAIGTASLAKPTFNFTLQSKAMELPSMPSAGGGEATTSFSLDKKDFSFTMKPKSPGKVGKSPLKFGGGAGDGDDDGDDTVEEEENNTYFTPVIPLPDKVDVKTGEENEELLYVHRAKLYRYTGGEWKERGVGDLKILRHCETRKLRVVMRRDQVFKICLNHALNEDVQLQYKRKDEKSWLFVVNDFSEGELELGKFSLRFKNADVASDFMLAVNTAIAGTAAPIEDRDDASQQANLPNISSADKKLADELKLPYDFFTVKPACSGCRGCDPDSFVFPIVGPSPVQAHKSLRPLELPALTIVLNPTTTVPQTATPTGGNRSLLLKQSALTPALGTQSAVATDASTEKSKSVAASGNPFSGSKSSAASFSFTAALNSTAQPEEATAKAAAGGGFLFGGGGGGTGAPLFGIGAAEKKTVFGQSAPIFGNMANVNGGGNSLFGGAASKTATTTSTTTAGSGGTLFGGKAMFGESKSKSIFNNGNANANSTSNSGSLFGASATFGGNSSFGSGSQSPMQTSIFGGASTIPPSLLGGGAAKAAVGSPAAAAAPTFADLSSQAIDFASIAARAKSDNPAADKTAAEQSAAGGFIGLTNQDAFSSFLKSSSNNNNSKNSSFGTLKSPDGNANESARSADDDGGAGNNDENYDPHYEPIIALPNEIEVSTGEEEETKLFGERATLFRWDNTNKEWKERGVGELKLLFHPVKQTYRLIMRREQIFKLVLNHAIGASFTFNIMNNNPKSFVWASMNYAESLEGVLEKLAVRFKQLPLAEKFGAELKQCIEAAKNTTKQQ